MVKKNSDNTSSTSHSSSDSNPPRPAKPSKEAGGTPALPGFRFGTIVGFHGLQGEVKVRPIANKPEILADVTTVQTAETKFYDAIDLTIRSIHFDKRMYYLAFEGFPDRTSVEHLMGAELMTWEDQILELEEEEFWVKDLIGMKVINQAGESIGEVVDIIYGGNDILEIHRPEDPIEKTILVPFVKTLVPEVDRVGRVITVAEIPGLLEAQ